MALERKLVNINVEKISKGNSVERIILKRLEGNPAERKIQSCSKENPAKRNFPVTDNRKSKPKLDICRLCLSKNCDFFPLFWAKLRFSSLPLRHVIETCLGIRAEKEDVTDRICQGCLAYLESMWAFREKCQQSNETIMRMNMSVDNVQPISGSEIQIPNKRTKDNVCKSDASMISLVTSSEGGQKVLKSQENNRLTPLEKETLEVAEIEQATANEESTAEEVVTMAYYPEMTHSDQEITVAGHDYEIDAEAETPSERIPGGRDGTWIHTDGKGYYYHTERIINNKRYLSCAESTICAVRGVMGLEENAPIRITNDIEHSHPPNFQIAEEKRFIHQVKKRAIEDTHLTISEIINEVAAGMEPGVVSGIKNLRRAIARARRVSLKQCQTGHSNE